MRTLCISVKALLAVGMRADLLVLDQNSIEIEAAAVHKTTALFTMMSGRLTHRNGI